MEDGNNVLIRKVKNFRPSSRIVIGSVAGVVAGSMTRGGSGDLGLEEQQEGGPIVEKVAEDGREDGSL